MRILAGTFKGRKLLPPPRSAETRPITALVKKSLMGMLAGRLDGAVVVDLFSGTGTIGLEAISQGARLCCFAERDGKVLARLQRNIDSLGAADRCTLWRGDVHARLADWLAELGEPVDVAMVDPPYSLVGRWDWPRAERTVFAPLARHLAADGLVVLRLPKRVPLPQALGGLTVRRHREYGEMTLDLLARPEGG